MSVRGLAPVRSVKVKLGLLVAASVIVAVVVTTIGEAGGVPIALSIPVTVALALAVTQLLAVGMTSPLREMTTAAQRMAAGDHTVRVTATSRDEVGVLAEAFNRMAEELAAVDRHRRELVANVSHELRTPLAALNAVLENLADGVAEPDPVTLRAALDQGERMAGLVGDLLDLSRVDAGKAPLARETIDVRRLLDVADQGPGVAPEHRERAFERFGTLSEPGDAGGGGTGLGLAIARWVTDLHGGTIRFVDSGPGGTGARVRADLPIAPTPRPFP